MIRYTCHHRECGDSGPFGHQHLTGFGVALSVAAVVATIVSALLLEGVSR